MRSKVALDNQLDNELQDGPGHEPARARLDPAPSFKNSPEPTRKRRHKKQPCSSLRAPREIRETQTSAKLSRKTPQDDKPEVRSTFQRKEKGHESKPPSAHPTRTAAMTVPAVNNRPLEGPVQSARKTNPQRRAHVASNTEKTRGKPAATAASISNPGGRTSESSISAVDSQGYTPMTSHRLKRRTMDSTEAPQLRPEGARKKLKSISPLPPQKQIVGTVKPEAFKKAMRCKSLKHSPLQPPNTSHIPDQNSAHEPLSQNVLGRQASPGATHNPKDVTASIEIAKISPAPRLNADVENGISPLNPLPPGSPLPGCAMDISNSSDVNLCTWQNLSIGADYQSITTYPDCSPLPIQIPGVINSAGNPVCKMTVIPTAEFTKVDAPIPEDILMFSPDVPQPSDVTPITEPRSLQVGSSFEHTKLEVMDEINLNQRALHKPQASPCYKPPLLKHPPIWAQSRQEVCESFDWFRSYQGGVYFCKNVVKGYLLSAFSSYRDAFENGGKLIISHGGGGAESIHHRQGQATTEAAVDQHAQDKSVRALLQNYKEVRPLVLLIDDKYALFPYDLGSKNVTYAVLGFYTITHAWAEYQPANNIEGRVVRYKFAFEWCRGQGEPWWLPKIEDNLGDILARPLKRPARESLWPASKKPLVKVDEYKLSDNLGQPSREDVYATCEMCHEKTPQVYRQQWVCLNRACTKFWVGTNGTAPSLPLEYNIDFLRLSRSFLLPTGLADVRPEPPILPVNGITTTYAFTRGWHCRICGRLSCRFKWEHWECSHCKTTVRVWGKLHNPSDFWALNSPTTSFHDHSIARNSGITQEPMKTFSLGKGMGQTQTFVLPDGKGRIHHIQSGAKNSDKADEIFKEYQEQAADGKLLFRRWPLRSHKCRGPLLTNYFSQNSGEPYQYVGGTANTVPFSDAPGAVVKAREFIQTRIQQALGIDSTFNEVLSAAYMERQKMAFHSDAEPGLGPLVAGLSLGSSALIHFRPHSTPKAHPVVISFVLRHGDVLVMDGAGVQRYYEHTVIPTNFRIAATARNIYPSHV